MPSISIANTAQTKQLDADPNQFAEPPKRREGDACDVEVTKGSHEEHIPGMLGPRLPGMRKVPTLVEIEDALMERPREERKVMPVTAMI